MSHTIAIDARKLGDFGIGTYVDNLLNELSEIDQDNEYLLFVRPGEESRVAHLPKNFRAVPEAAPVYSMRELLALSWRLRRLRVDLYHSTHYVLPLFLPCKTVVTIHDIIHLLFPDFLPSRLAHAYARHMMRRALVQGDAIIAVSRNTKEDLASYYKVEGNKIHVIYNGVERLFRRRLEPSEIEHWLATLGIRRPYMLFVGNPKPHKNLDRVIQAYARAVEIGELDVPLVCVGARQGTDFKIRLRAEQLGIADRVQLLGHVAKEALPALYQGATLSLYPTLYEGFGLPVIESMASGTAVITSNNSALREIAGGYAHLVDPLDIDEMARAIAHCMSDDEHRESLETLGARRAEAFDWRQTAEQTHELYRRILRW